MYLFLSLFFHLKMVGFYVNPDCFRNYAIKLCIVPYRSNRQSSLYA